MLADDVRGILDNRSLRGEARIAALVALLDPVVYEVWPRKTHAEIDSVEAYGLSIGLDANGYACAVEFPYGAETDV